jgi:hypothetical protein
MKPVIHAITSFSLGVVLWFFTKSFSAAFLCFISGTIVDFDHVIEYIIHFGRKSLTLKNLYHVCEEMLFNRLYVIFHSIELVILFWLAALLIKNIYLLAISMGYTSHLILDLIGNPLHPFSYFLVRRFKKRFVTERLIKKNFRRGTKKG